LTAACVLSATTKKVVNFFEEKCIRWGLSDLEKLGSFIALEFAPDDLPHDLSNLEMTSLP